MGMVPNNLKRCMMVQITMLVVFIDFLQCINTNPLENPFDGNSYSRSQKVETLPSFDLKKNGAPASITLHPYSTDLESTVATTTYFYIYSYLYLCLYPSTINA